MKQSTDTDSICPIGTSLLFLHHLATASAITLVWVLQPHWFMQEQVRQVLTAICANLVWTGALPLFNASPA